MKETIKELFPLIKEGSEVEVLPLLEKAGFREPDRSYKNLTLLFEDGAFRGIEESLIEEAADSPDPDLALNNLERLLQAFPEDLEKETIVTRENLKALCTLCGGSRFLTNIALRRPHLLHWLFVEGNLRKSTSLEEKTGEIRHAVRDVENMTDLQRTLRLFKGREYLRIGLRDLLCLTGLEEVMGEISDLASSTLQSACEASAKLLERDYGRPFYIDEKGEEKTAGFVVLGMGKLGGRELNFSSDIDLIFLYTTDKGETAGIEKDGALSGKITLHEYFVKMGKMIIKAMNEVTEDGFVFRVDMELRPEGQFGDLACSVRSAEIYYESWGQTWERAAMLKARPVAGDTALGEKFLALIRPFKYRKYLDYTAIEEIRTMKKKIDAKIARDDQTLRNLKLGTGGIREIEFFIQALQLINGGKREAIRERNSLFAIVKLKEAGLINEEERRKLTGAYVFLRKVEHRLQIFEERQTHTLPNNEAELEKQARRIGYRENALEAFLSEHRLHTGNVKKIYSSLFHEAAEKLEEEKTPEILELLEGVLRGEEAIERLSAYGFEDPAAALKNLSLLWNGPPFAHFTEKSKVALRSIAPLIFREVLSSPEPGMALNTFEKFISAVGARGTLYSLLAENHHVIRFLVRLFGTSSFLSKILLSYPETLDSLVACGASAPMKTRDDMRNELHSAVVSTQHYEEKLDAMRRFRNVEVLRIGVNDIYGEIDLPKVSSQLTALAEVSLDLAYDLALEQMKSRYGIPMISVDGRQIEAKMSIIGMGKLGGEEMAYSSDLDIIFIYSGGGETNGVFEEKKDLKIVSNHEFFAKVGQAIISILSIPTREGYVFKVDTRLRPSGSSGPLVASVQAFRDYHRERAQTWEIQALARARVLTGDEELGREVAGIIENALYGRLPAAGLGQEINRMRKRMEFELAKEQDGIYNVKTGKGGLVDIEFLAQFLQLKYGASNVEIRTPNTAEALEKLCSAGIVMQEDYAVLTVAYKFLRSIENGLRIVHDQSVSKLDSNSRDFGRLAKRLGYSSSDLLSNYLNLTAKVRDIYNRYLEGSA